MSKIIKTYNACALLSKYNRLAALSLANDAIRRRVNLIFQAYQQGKRRRAESHGPNFLPIAIPLAITTAACQQFSKHNEKRFFRAVQYGVDDEVRR